MSVSPVDSTSSWQLASPTGVTSTTTATAARPAPPPPPPSSGGTEDRATPPHVEAAAEALGLSTDEVLEALAGGASLADLADEQGVSRDDLVAALVDAAPDDLRSLSNITEMTEALVDQDGLACPAGPPPAGSSGVWGAQITSSQNATLDAVASLVGVDTTTLVEQLRSGTELADLLEDAGVSVQDLADALEEGFLFDSTV